MEEEVRVTLEATITEKDVKATFEKVPTLKRAFDNFWESQHMEEWVKQTLNPAIAKSPEVISSLHDAMKVGVMCTILDYSLQRLLEAQGTSSFTYCIEKVIVDEGEKVITINKVAWFKAIKELNTELQSD